VRERVSGSEDAIEGEGGAFDLTLGWAFRPGLVGALSFMADRADEPRLTLLSAGVVLVWYPRPGGAFHLRGGLVGSRLTVGDGEGRDEDRGPGLVLGAGLETQVFRRWSAGVLLRGIVSRLGDRGDDHGVGAVSLLVTLSRS
jgi:hypothetical protein